MLKLKPSEVRAAEIMEAQKVDRAKAERIVRKRRRHLPIGVTSAHIYVKVFKSIPQVDLEMLFPNTKIDFKPFDKLKLCVTAGGGTVAGVMGTATKLLAATNPFTLAAGLAGLSAVIFRQVMNSFNTRNRYMMVLAQNLYFCSLANNRGALTLIADSAEEEDVKEDMLLYAFLVRGKVRRSDLASVKSEIDAFLSDRCQVAVSFDAEDALRRLMEDGLVTEAADGTLVALAPPAAREHLDKRWDRLLDVDVLDEAAAAHANA
jgi:transcription initiation factor TFIIIB Brf1 subunit/transcription initiation factor TFIIB